VTEQLVTIWCENYLQGLILALIRSIYELYHSHDRMKNVRGIRGQLVPEKQIKSGISARKKQGHCGLIGTRLVCTYSILYYHIIYFFP